jgi:[ribosomal protein S5]-alanine N-acetyltransferase
VIHTRITLPSAAPAAAIPEDEATINWRASLPVLQAGGATIRELRLSDAASLLAFLSTEEVSRFISPPPTTVAGFERFIEWAQRERAMGNYVCFGVVPSGFNQAVGLFQVRQMNGSFETSEWGFAIGCSFWGTGLFVDAARAVMRFMFDTIGAQRLEARSSVQNGRGNGALQKLGAMREGILRRAFLREGVYHDQILWSIVASDWRAWMHSFASSPAV